VADARTQFSAKLDPIDAIGARPSSEVVRVRDVLVCTTTDTDVSSEELNAHLPIGFPPLPFDEPPSSGAPVELGRRLSIGRLSDDDSQLVMNACTPRGHYFAPIPQFGQRYSFIRNVDLDEWRGHPFRWDEEGVISDALMLSRLIRDNGQSTMFAARIADFADGEQTVAYTLPTQGKSVYRLRRDRDWLDESEGAELRSLLAAFWAIGERALPARVRRAIFRTEYASWLPWADLALPILIGGLESLLKTDRHPSTRQFTTRVPALAAELGFDGINADFCEEMYDARSEWVHGAHVRLFSTGLDAEQSAEQGAAEGPEDAEQRDAIADIARVQDVLRGAVRRCIEDEDFRAIFADDDRIRSPWPL
jgi:hypothetical protein